jgi:hypothetical protein
MRHAGARTAGLAARTGALATPPPELERELTAGTPGRGLGDGDILIAHRL